MIVNYDAHGTRSVQLVTGVTAAGRLAAGLLGFARPEPLPRMLGLDRGTSSRSTVLVRLFAAREIAVGLGTLYALRGGRDARPWLVAQAICDAGDTLAFAAATRERILPPARGIAVTALALAGLVSTVAAVRGARR